MLIGDPTLLGWLIALAYAVTAWLCWRKSSAHVQNNDSYLFWRLLALLLIVFALNKQLDIQSLFRELAKFALDSLNMRDVKLFVKLALLAGLGCLLLAAGSVGLWMFLQQNPRPWFALAGSTGLLAFVLAKAISVQKLGIFGGYSDIFWGAMELISIGLILTDLRRNQARVDTFRD